MSKVNITFLGTVIGYASGWDDAGDNGANFYNVEMTKQIFDIDIPKGSDLFIFPFEGNYYYTFGDSEPIYLKIDITAVLEILNLPI